MANDPSSSTLTSTSFDAFNSQLQVNALKATRNGLALPSDVAFHRSMDAEFTKDLDNLSSRVLSLANKVIALAATANTTSSKTKGKARLENADDAVDNFHALVVDSMDQLMERTHNAVAPASTLFGSTLTTIHNEPQTSTVFSTTRSSLFANTSSSISPSSVLTNENSHLNPHFRDVVARINRTLVIAPSVPSALDNISDHGAEDAKPAITELSGMQVEIPFIPASQRKAVQPIVDDSIVTVGQARQRKRKRTKPPADGLIPTTSAEKSNSEEVEPQNATKDSTAVNDQEPFDFATVPNILDDNPDVEDTKQKKRQKKQKSGGNFYGDFPAPPKAHSEFKRGNQSFTFKQ
ncbi:hypothetical protein H0H93_009746 [Arthromyces matolae]|nr:hypothetical protein H0H93_009746 [Arthromyces matolae]